VIEYASSADLPAAETLAKLVSNVTLKQDPNLTSSTLHLILGSTFTSLSSSASSSSSGSAISSLAQTYGGITGNTNICSDSGAFAGPDGD
jgi:hypothetical protein